MEDATTEGVQIVGDTPIEVGVAHQLRVDIPLQDGDTGEIVLSAHSRWARWDPDARHWSTGFSFERTAPRAKVIVDFLIRGDAR